MTGLFDLGANISETAFEDKLRDTAPLFGWRFHAERTSKTQSGRWATAVKGDVGFPDVVMAHVRHGLVIVELKAQKGSLGEGQAEWLSTMDAHQARRVLVEVWRPVDWAHIMVCLRNGIAAYRAVVERDGGLKSRERRRGPWPITWQDDPDS